MGPSQARDHLDSVATILRDADRRLGMPPAVLVAWGLVGAMINVLAHARGLGAALPSDSVLQPLMFLTAIAVTAWAAKRGSGRETRIDREAAVAFGVVCAVLVVASVVAQGELLPYRGMAVVWAFGIAQALLIVGLLGSRVLALGGVALLAGGVAACFLPSLFHLALASGWVAGMVAPGVVLAARPRHG